MFNRIIEFVKAKLGKDSSTLGQLSDDVDDTNDTQASNGDLSTSVDNNNIRSKQTKVLGGILVAVIIAMGFLIYFVQKKVVVKEVEKKSENLKIELADKALDGEKLWHSQHEDDLKNIANELKGRLDKAEESAKQTKSDIVDETKREIEALKEQLKMATAELGGATNNINLLTAREQERINSLPVHEESVLEVEDYEQTVELDIPKSAKDYVPEGTYFTGYLLRGIVVSTALNAPEERNVPVTIKLKGRGNLAPENKTDISQCHITGSTYGDLSSERAVIRLEKLICKKNGMYETSDIVGDVDGPDGLNGIKGEVIATSSKHIKNAMIGGIISGLGNSAKGQDAMNITTGGIISSSKKGFKDVAKEGVLTGVGNYADVLSEVQGVRDSILELQ